MLSNFIGSLNLWAMTTLGIPGCIYNTNENSAKKTFYGFFGFVFKGISSIYNLTF